MENLVILGSGGYGRTLQDVAEQLGYEILALIDDKDKKYPLNSFSNYISTDIEFIPAFGDNEFCLLWLETISSAQHAHLDTLNHSTVYVSSHTVIKEGSVILPSAIVNTGTVVERGVIVNIGCIVDHDCVIEEGFHFASGVVVKGENRIVRCSRVESGEGIEVLIGIILNHSRIRGK